MAYPIIPPLPPPQLGVLPPMPYPRSQQMHYPEVPPMPYFPPYNAQPPMHACPPQPWPMHAPYFPGPVRMQQPPAMCCYPNPMLPARPPYANCGWGVGAYCAGMRPSAGIDDTVSNNLRVFDNELVHYLRDQQMTTDDLKNNAIYTKYKKLTQDEHNFKLLNAELKFCLNAILYSKNDHFPAFCQGLVLAEKLKATKMPSAGYPDE